MKKEALDLIRLKNSSNYNELITYCYSYYDRKIKSAKSQKVKNKYIMIRKKLLSYILTDTKKAIEEIINNP